MKPLRLSQLLRLLSWLCWLLAVAPLFMLSSFGRPTMVVLLGLSYLAGHVSGAAADLRRRGQ